MTVSKVQDTDIDQAQPSAQRASEPHGSQQKGHRQFALFEPEQVPDYSLDGFVISPATAPVVETLRAWHGSPELMLVICGPASSGKTHLTHVLAHFQTHDQQQSSGRDSAVVMTAQVNDAIAHCAGNEPAREPTDRTGILILDEIEASAIDPRRLLDLVETCRANQQRLVLSGRGNPGGWAGDLKDLYTRIEAMARITMPEPDEPLIRSIIVRLLRSRQLAFEPDKIEQIAERAARNIPRTFAAAALFTRSLDMEAMCDGRKPSRDIVTRVLDTYF